MFRLLILIVLIGGVILQADRGLQLKKMKEEQRVALVVGNNDYVHLGKLKNPINDARLMKKVLAKRGFEVIFKENATKYEMIKLVQKFTKKLSRGGIGLYYFAGHGVNVDGSNYLVGTNSLMDDKDLAKMETLALNYVTSRMKNSGNRLNIVILDACRNNPFERGGDQGLAPVSNAKGIFIAYATEAGSVASDGGGGKNGVFTKYLVKNLQESGATIEKVFKNTRADVEDATDGRQSPGVYNQIRGDFFFTLPKEKKRVEVTEIQSDDFMDNLPTKYSLTIRAVPKDAKVMITNIKQKYRKGMKLEEGVYKLKVAKDGYITKVGKITLRKNTRVVVTLEKKRKDIVIKQQEPKKQIKPKKRTKQKGRVVQVGTLLWQDTKESKTITKSWSGAKEYCQSLSLNGYDDWRVPNYNELLSLVDYSKYYPAIKDGFENVASNSYWSSSETVSDSSYAWGVFFSFGYTYDSVKTDEYYVRCVRGRQ